MIVLGLDSATKTGFGLVEKRAGSERLLDSGMVDLSDKAIVARTIEDFAHRIAGNHEIDLVAIEDNYLDMQEGKGNVLTLKVMSRFVGRFQQAFEGIGITTILVNPQKWAVGLLRGPLMGTSSNRETRKKACALWVKATFGVVPSSQDAADGIGIATYEARQRAFAQRAGSEL